MLSFEGEQQEDIRNAHFVSMLRTARAQHSRENKQSTLCRLRSVQRRIFESNLNEKEKRHLFEFLRGDK